MQLPTPVIFLILFASAILIAGIGPFILGFLIKSLFIRRQIPKYFSWIAALIIVAAFGVFSRKGIIYTTDNSLFVRIAVNVAAVIVISGFIDSRMRIRRKIRDRKNNNATTQVGHNKII
jgi:hypothetical protein